MSEDLVGIAAAVEQGAEQRFLLSDGGNLESGEAFFAGLLLISAGLEQEGGDLGFVIQGGADEQGVA